MDRNCCEDFKWRYETSQGMGLNIRVARLIRNSELAETGFFITEGYTDDSIGVKFCKINYCPFCGSNLQEYYKDTLNIVNSNIEDFAKL